MSVESLQTPRGNSSIERFSSLDDVLGNRESQAHPQLDRLHASLDQNGSMTDSVMTPQRIGFNSQSVQKSNATDFYTRYAPDSLSPVRYSDLLHNKRTCFWPKDRKFVQLLIWNLSYRISKAARKSDRDPQLQWALNILSQYRMQLLSDPFNLHSMLFNMQQPLDLKPSLKKTANRSLEQVYSELQAVHQQLIADNTVSLRMLIADTLHSKTFVPVDFSNETHELRERLSTGLTKTEYVTRELLSMLAHLHQKSAIWSTKINAANT